MLLLRLMHDARHRGLGSPARNILFNSARGGSSQTPAAVSSDGYSGLPKTHAAQPVRVLALMLKRRLNTGSPGARECAELPAPAPSLRAGHRRPFPSPSSSFELRLYGCVAHKRLLSASSMPPLPICQNSCLRGLLGCAVASHGQRGSCPQALLASIP